MILAPRAALTKAGPHANDADHPRFLESVVGRLLELVVYSVEGIRSRVHKLPVH